MTVNAEDILNAAKSRLNALTQAYENEDLKTFKSLAETSFIAGDEEIKFPVPVLDDDYSFMYKGHKFMVLNNVAASNNALRSKGYMNTLTDITTIWEVVYEDDTDSRRFVNWLYWEFDIGMKVDDLALDYVKRYLEKMDNIKEYYEKEVQHA